MSLATVVRVYEIPDMDRSQQTDKETAITLIYRVEFSGPAYIFQAYTANDGTDQVPTYGDELEIGTELTGMFANNVSPQRIEPHVIDVYVTFSTLSSSPFQTGKWNVNIKSSFQEVRESTTNYADGTPIVNSAAQIYQPLQTRTYYDEVFVITYTTDSLSADALAAAYGNVNTDAVTMTVKGVSRNFAVNTLKFKAEWSNTQSGSAGVAPTWTNYNVTVTLVYRNTTWLVKIVDQGTCDNNGRPFKDKDGNPVTSPAYMNGAGQPLFPPGTAAGTTNAVFVIPAGKLIDPSTAFAPLLSGIE